MSLNLKPIVLVILDGFGHSEEKEGNAIAQPINLPGINYGKRIRIPILRVQVQKWACLLSKWVIPRWGI